jgi:YtkA-like
VPASACSPSAAPYCNDCYDDLEAIAMTRRILLFPLLLAGLSLAACQAPPPVALAAQTETYTVDLELDSATLGQRTATIELAGPEPAEVLLSPAMPQMNMTGTEMVATKVDDGRYEARGEFFSMLGDWQVEVKIDGPTGQEVAAFDIEIEP